MQRLWNGVAAGLLSLVLATSAYAVEPPDYGDGGGPGCGLGTFLFKDKEGKANHVMAALTNSVALINTFAVTSGTLGCKTDGVVQRQYERQIFAANNLPQLLHDMARADGEYLSVFAELSGIPANQQTGFFRFAQSHLSHHPDSADSTVFLATFDDALSRQQVRL